MGTPRVKIAILTSSRADFGIYLPLLRLLSTEENIATDVIAFGTHLSARYGNTLSHIQDAGFNIAWSFDTAPATDTPGDIARSMAETTRQLTKVWENSHYDLIFALGDRYEMFAAVASTLPFNLKIAHIHGGETTLGAIDNAFRHAITHMSAFHFTGAEPYRLKVCQLIDSDKNVYNTGALGIDNLSKIKLMEIDEFKNQFGIDLHKPSILITLHPETIGFEQNRDNAAEMLGALEMLSDFQQIITMPNADTSGLIIRELIEAYSKNRPNVKVVESFGSLGYLSAMKHCTLMLGNTSSGFMEASFFPKWVINLGKRQDGRIRTPNIIDTAFDRNLITETIRKVCETRIPDFEPVYGDGHAAEKILNILKDELGLN